MNGCMDGYGCFHHTPKPNFYESSQVDVHGQILDLDKKRRAN